MQKQDSASAEGPTPADWIPLQEPDSSDPNDFPWPLNVALSGGGLRASAFGLGALLYLKHAGLNTKVTDIASVSGGSITNGFIASRCDYQSVDDETFDKVASKLASKIAFSGMWGSVYVWSYILLLFFASAGAE